MKSGDFEVDDGMVVSRARYKFLKDQNKELKKLVDGIWHIAVGRDEIYRDDAAFQLRGIQKLIRKYEDD